MKAIVSVAMTSLGTEHANICQITNSQAALAVLKAIIQKTKQVQEWVTYMWWGWGGG